MLSFCVHGCRTGSYQLGGITCRDPVPRCFSSPVVQVFPPAESATPRPFPFVGNCFDNFYLVPQGMLSWKKRLKPPDVWFLFSARNLHWLDAVLGSPAGLPAVPKPPCAPRLPLFALVCNSAAWTVFVQPFFQLLIPLKSQEDLDRAVEHLDLSPSLKSLRVFVKTPKKTNVSCDFLEKNNTSFVYKAKRSIIVSRSGNTCRF